MAVSLHHTGPVTGVIICPEDTILTSSRDGKVRKLLIKKDKMKTRLKLDSGFCLQHQDCVIATSMEKFKLLTGCSDAKVILWDMKTQEQIRAFRGHSNGIRTVCLRNNLAASGSKVM